MAPIDFQTHTCEHCQRMVIDINHFKMRNRDETDMAVGGALFDITFKNLLSLATAGCKLCIRILDDECISRDAVTSQVTNDLAEDDPYRRVIEALQDQAINLDVFHKNSMVKTTFREIASTSDSLLLHHRLFAKPYQGSGEVLDIDDIEYFGLWNPDTKKISYRTKHGFRVFTNSEDTASRTILTRPIDASPGSDENLERISTWLQKCQSSHLRCRSTLGTMPERLIEIIETPTRFGIRVRHTQDIDPAPFAALSYCWGGDQPLKCLTSNITQLMTVIPLGDLPPTILDAVKVCRRIGLRYIWIDALCILQDDLNDKAIEIAKMPYIYGSSTITIAAARPASVHVGFLHRRDFSAQNEAFVLPYRHEDGQVGSVTLIEVDESQEPIDERGWTFQERLLSLRTIEFGSRQTRWICQESKYKIGYTDGWRRDPEYSRTRRDHLKLEGFSNTESLPIIKRKGYESIIREWNSIVETFTIRKLTVPSDRSLAISGIAEVFAKTLGDVYIAGMWKSCLLSGLLWQIPEFDTAFRASLKQGPSWSWMSVNGPVLFPSKYFSFGHSESRNYTAEVVDLKLDPEHRLAPYGAIRHDSGRLKLRAHTAIGAIAKTPGSSVLNRNNEMIGFFGKNDSGVAIGMANLFRDVKDDNEHSGDNTSVTVVELYNTTAGPSWYCSGLVLQPTEHEGFVYRRVGMFEFETRRDGQQENESAEDWKRRIDSKFNWFKSCDYSVIEIV